MRPMGPTIDVGCTKISSAAQASQYPPEAATSSQKASTGTSFSRAMSRMRLAISADCEAEPPGELMTRATAFRRGRAKACSIRSEEHTSELQSLLRISYAVFCLIKKTTQNIYRTYYIENNVP